MNTWRAFCPSVTYCLLSRIYCLTSTAVTAIRALAKALRMNALISVVDLNCISGILKQENILIGKCQSSHTILDFENVPIDGVDDIIQIVGWRSCKRKSIVEDERDIVETTEIARARGIARPNVETKREHGASKCNACVGRMPISSFL